MHSKENKEFREKCQNNAALKAKMAQTDKKFRQFEQLALYTDQKESCPRMFITIKKEDTHFWGSSAEGINLIVVVGIYQPQGAKSIEKIVLSLVNHVPRPAQNYSVIYVNTLVTSNAYGDFKNILEFLPTQYLTFLDRIYVVNAHFKHKASYWIKFDLVTSYIKNKTVHLSSFRELADRLKVQGEKLLDIVPKEIVTALEKKEEWVKNYQAQKRAKECIIYNTDIFNVQKDDYLEKSNEKLVKSLLKMKMPSKEAQNSIESYEVGQTGAPLIIELLISYFNGKEELLDSEGLFRKSVDCGEEAVLLKELSLRNYDYIEQISDPHLIANAIKRFLSSLAEPIIPFQDYQHLMQLSQDKYKQTIVQIAHSLPLNRKMTLLLLVQFFKQKFLVRTSANKMTENSVCIVLAPCLMRSETASMKDLVDAKKAISITLIMFKDFDEMFGNKKERTQLIRKSVHLQERESLKDKLGELNQLSDPLEPGQDNGAEGVSKQQQNGQGQAGDILKSIESSMHQQLGSKLEQQQQFQQPMVIQQGKL